MSIVMQFVGCMCGMNLVLCESMKSEAFLHMNHFNRRKEDVRRRWEDRG